MNKLRSLREHLLASVPDLRRDPERLLTFIDAGRIRCTATHSLSFEYSYTLNCILTDYAGHPDAVFVPMLAWLKMNQPDADDDIVQFEADVLTGTAIDLSIKLSLTERVQVIDAGDGRLTATHLEEPQPGAWLDDTPLAPIGPRQLYANGELITELGTSSG
ncbi:MAG TPA: phage tail protein [Plasticicumulans sp.]|uniref:phage tail protein n=1 Tax=Plasticicumulans sp. TaxID=2307179 RepID=UPI002C1F389F|nr:phage tail protein [Rhodocyclaceae bacterium]HMZ10769.1 phage tail protein [Plasticicumulans sp.]